jgi:hypothetical protein
MVFEIVPDTNKTESGRSNQMPHIVARYPDESLLISGWILGDSLIRNKAAILDVPVGKGRVILYGFSVHNRAQSHVNFKLLFNAMYF